MEPRYPRTPFNPRPLESLLPVEDLRVLSSGLFVEPMETDDGLSFARLTVAESVPSGFWPESSEASVQVDLFDDAIDDAIFRLQLARSGIVPVRARRAS